MSSIPEALQLATEHHLAGRLPEAEAIYQEILKAEPQNAQALHLLGVIAHQVGKNEIAIDLIRQAIERNPDDPTFRNNLGEALRLSGRLTDAMAQYEKAIALKSDYAEPYLNWGLALAHLGRHVEARASFRKALEVRPDYQAPFYELLRLYRKVPRWHFPMMNDVDRNDAYAAAIKKTVRPGDLVLDIGTGSGLLAMMAARAGAKHVFACEELPLISRKAEEIIARNHLQKAITVLHKRSTKLVIGTDLPEPADVLITEIFDVGFLGENLKETLLDTGRLLKPQARVIPMAAKIFVALLESEPVHRQYVVGDARGFDLSPYNEFSADPYWQLNLKHYPHRFLTEPRQILELSIPHCENWPTQASLALNVHHGGYCHAICFWFDLVLTSKITLTNAPYKTGDPQSTHWGQCVQILHQPAALRKGQTIKMRVVNKERYFHFEYALGA